MRFCESNRSAGHRGESRVEQSGPLRAHDEGPAMSDKSPRQAMSKKSDKSLKEKRAAKHAKSAAKSSAAESAYGDKKR